MANQHKYTSAQALVDLGGKPSDDEIERLIKYYPTYQIVHRWKLLHGLFDGKSHEELVLGKLTAKGLDTTVIKQAKGGHGRWVVAKVRRAVFRLLYLRLRFEDGLTQRQANQALWKRFLGNKRNVNAISRSSITKATSSPVLDGSTSL